VILWITGKQNPRVKKSKEKLATICMSLEEIAVPVGHEVLMAVELYFTDCW
jgi:hypothetical protein